MLTHQEIETIYRDNDYTFEAVIKVAEASAIKAIKNIRSYAEPDTKIWEAYAQHLAPDEKQALAALTDSHPNLSSIVQYLVEAAFMHGYKKGSTS